MQALWRWADCTYFKETTLPVDNYTALRSDGLRPFDCEHCSRLNLKSSKFSMPAKPSEKIVNEMDVLPVACQCDYGCWDYLSWRNDKRLKKSANRTLSVRHRLSSKRLLKTWRRFSISIRFLIVKVIYVGFRHLFPHNMVRNFWVWPGDILSNRLFALTRR